MAHKKGHKKKNVPTGDQPKKGGGGKHQNNSKKGDGEKQSGKGGAKQKNASQIAVKIPSECQFCKSLFDTKDERDLHYDGCSDYARWKGR